jgi:Flp pilus assembly pilin Flp
MFAALLRCRFVRDCRGQDLVEYALLVALIGIAATASAPAIETALSAAYTVWNTQTQDVWQMPDPGAGGS